MRSFLTALVAALLFAGPLARAEAQVKDLPDFADLVEKVGPSVVGIRTTERVHIGANGMPQDDQDLDDLFRKFFGVPVPQQPNPQQQNPSPHGKSQPRGNQPDREVTRGVGSGFVLSSDGFILTNSHVVEGASEIYVTLTDKREFKGKVIGSDSRTDVALVKIDAAGLPKMQIGDSKQIRVGQWVLAIGSPFGLENTVTAGIVSAKSRDTGDYLPFIQTDTAVNPGNSGGPLINMRGEVIGINSQILSETGGSIGIAFAIPIDEAMRVVDQLRSTGRVVRGRLGVQIRDVNKEEADAIGLKPQGALVSRVEKGSPAEKAGLQAFDIILKFDGQTIERSADLPRAVGETKPGTHSVVQVWRKGTVRDVPIVVSELENPGKPAVKSEEPKASPTNSLGLAVSDLSDDKRHELGISGGVEVTSVDGAASAADVRVGDVIVGVNNSDVSSAKQFADLVAKLDPKKQAFLLVMRGDAARYVPIKPGN
ncbi:MAG: DegQ family serine endoprotease [Burkholderiaceae bacterium]|jgi:serine protease Do